MSRWSAYVEFVLPLGENIGLGRCMPPLVAAHRDLHRKWEFGHGGVQAA